jgi:anti-sigma regulatory factor (Ser/Thr protein kinase)
MRTAGSLEQRWRADPRVLPAVRRAVREWGALAGLAEETVEDLQLLVSEAASNSVEHAYRDIEPGEFELSVGLGPEGGVRVVVRDSGRWRPPPLVTADAAWPSSTPWARTWRSTPVTPAPVSPSP